MHRTTHVLAGSHTALPNHHGPIPRSLAPITSLPAATPAAPGSSAPHPGARRTVPRLAASLLAAAAVLSLAAAAEASHPINAWTLDEGSGTQAAPSAGTAYGTLGSTARFTPSLIRGGVQLVPASDYDSSSYVEFPAEVGKFGSGDFTVMFWYKTTFNRVGYHGDVLGNRRDASGGNYLALRVLGDGTLSVEINQDASGTNAKALSSGSVKVNDGMWHHIAVTRLGMFLWLYIDGAPIAGAIGFPANLTGNYPFRIGRSLPNCCSNFVTIPGSYDDLKIFNYAVNTAMIHETFEAAGSGLVSGLAKKFAPQLRFDQAASTFPMSAQQFYQNIVQTGAWRSPHSPYDNNSASSVRNGLVPTYYQVTVCGNQIRILYWWFYGYQPECTPGFGSHNGDWERVMVTLDEMGTNIAAVSFFQHSGWYTRLAERDGFGITSGTHPIIHVGKTAHGSYHDQGGNGTCLYYEDWRNYGNDKHMNSWMNLISLEQDNEPWMAADRNGGFTWGYEGVHTHPTQSGPSCTKHACKGKSEDWKTEGCQFSKSHCKLGDHGDGVTCWVPCQSGYTDMGLTCTNWDTWHTYNQEGYSYDYTLPTKDEGLMYEEN